MRIAAGVLTWNPLTNQRKKLLRQAVESLAGCDSVAVFDNGSTDVYDLDAEVIKLPRLKGFPHGNTCGYGMNKMAARLDADILVLSNDDVVWASDAVARLKAIWSEAPVGLKIVSGLVEPVFALPGEDPWNQPLFPLDVGERLVVRKSVPGGAWTLRGADRHLVFPVSTFHGVDDVPACHRLTRRGFSVAAADLAVHHGVESTWGNQSYQRLQVEPVESVRERFGC